MFLDSVSPSFEFAPPSRESFPRGITPSKLLAQIAHTVPFITEIPIGDGRAFLHELARAATNPERELGQAEYFRLCLSAHWASLASYVPTEVDRLIRFSLWNPVLPSDVVCDMAQTVMEAYSWDFTALSKRWIISPHSALCLSGHHGEWFSMAVAAYCAIRKRDTFLALRLREAIEYEVTREAKIYLEFRKARDGIGMLLASSLITQNLGELDRMIDAWNLSPEDPLHEFAYRAGHAEDARAARFGGALSEAGRMSREFMVGENPRYFALGAPRSLRRSPEFLLPLPPFLDEWGRILALHPELSPEDLGTIVEALFEGWEKLKGKNGAIVTHAYPRAVAGILEAIPGGVTALAPFLSTKVERNLRSGLFSSLVTVPRTRFMEQWSQKALGFMR